jgi:hypothetical protein
VKRLTDEEQAKIRKLVELSAGEMDPRPKSIDFDELSLERVTLLHDEGGCVTIFFADRGWAGGAASRVQHFGPDAAAGGYRGRLWREAVDPRRVGVVVRGDEPEGGLVIRNFIEMVDAAGCQAADSLMFVAENPGVFFRQMWPTALILVLAWIGGIAVIEISVGLAELAARWLFGG